MGTDESRGICGTDYAVNRCLNPIQPGDDLAQVPFYHLKVGQAQACAPLRPHAQTLKEECWKRGNVAPVSTMASRFSGVAPDGPITVIGWVNVPITFSSRIYPPTCWSARRIFSSMERSAASPMEATSRRDSVAV